jgi:hypothetical protein
VPVAVFVGTQSRDPWTLFALRDLDGKLMSVKWKTFKLWGASLVSETWELDL